MNTRRFFSFFPLFLVAAFFVILFSPNMILNPDLDIKSALKNSYLPGTGNSVNFRPTLEISSYKTGDVQASPLPGMPNKENVADDCTLFSSDGVHISGQCKLRHNHSLASNDQKDAL